MDDLLVKLARRESFTEIDLERAFDAVCYKLHACDCLSCPVAEANGGSVPEDDRGCTAFGSGKLMLAIIRGSAS